MSQDLALLYQAMEYVLGSQFADIDRKIFYMMDRVCSNNGNVTRNEEWQIILRCINRLDGNVRKKILLKWRDNQIIHAKVNKIKNNISNGR